MAISLMMEALQQTKDSTPSSTPRHSTHTWEESQSILTNRNERQEPRRSQEKRSDDVLAATAILSVYEFLDASGAAWSRHLNGTKSLLDIAQTKMVSIEVPAAPGCFQSLHELNKPSKARKAIFWNFARQDCLAACRCPVPLKVIPKLNVAVINECQTRLDTEDLDLWREAGLSIDANGFVDSSNNNSNPPEDDVVMKEDMICNALVWLISRLINYIAAGEMFAPIPAGHREENTEPDGPISIGVSQQTLLERWERIDRGIIAWHSGLPDTFKPCARIPHLLPPQGDEPSTSLFSEIWYSISMCGSTIQNYHMARILLLINKPHETTARRSTISRRLESYRLIQEEIMHHCREIVYVLCFGFRFLQAMASIVLRNPLL